MKLTIVWCTATTAVAIALCLEGCATTVLPQELVRPMAATSAAVTISNATTVPVRISLRRGSVDVMLGTVQGLSSRTFDVGGGMTEASELQLEARDRRGDVLWSDTFTFAGRRAALWQVGYRSARVDLR